MFRFMYVALLPILLSGCQDARYIGGYLLGVPIEGIVVNKIRSPNYEYDLKEIESIFNVPVLAKIKDHKKIAHALYAKKPITILDETNTISKEIKHFASAICGSPEKDGWFQKLIPIKNLIKKEHVNREIFREKFY